MRLGRCLAAAGIFATGVVASPPCAAAQPARAQSAAARSAAREVNAADLFAVRTISDVELSPDGKSVAFTVTGLPPDRSLDELRSRIHVASLREGGDRAVSADAHSARSPQWSPDGRWLAYISAESGTNDVWMVPATGGAARRVTRAPSPVRSYAWSPDGRRLAFVASARADANVAERQRLVRLASDTAPPAQLWVVSIDSPSVARALTQPPLNVMATPAWSSDGRSIAFIHSASSGMADAFSVSLSLVDVASARQTPLRHVGSYAASPHFSPNGKWVAVRAATERSAGAVGAAFYAIALGSDGRRGEEHQLGPADGTSEIAGWTPDGAAIIVTSQVGVTQRVRRLPIDGGAVAELYAGPLLVSDLHLGRDGTAAFAGEALESPPEVYRSTLAAFTPAPVTRINGGLALPAFGRTELVTWTSSGGATVEGLLTYPAHHAASQRAPLLVVAHAGGETFANTYVANPLAGSSRIYPPPVFTSRGYAVLRVNQRGGGLGGYGFDAFVPVFKPKEKANADILSGVDLVVRMGVADSSRVAIMGWSNGGLVTQSLITSSDRFAAASVFAGFPDLVLESGLNPWMDTDLGAAPWMDPARYVEHAPIFGMGRVRAATLVIHGSEDGIPVGEAAAFHGMLVKRGVPAELAIYPGMGHVPFRPRQMIDIAERNLAWFDRFLGRR